MKTSEYMSDFFVNQVFRGFAVTKKKKSTADNYFLAANYICDFCISNRAGILKMVVVALPGHVSNTAKKTHVSDSFFEDSIDGLVLDFFLKPDAGVPLSSINASR